MSSSLGDLLMCSVCIERYREKDRQPVLLPRCGHSFCRTCVAMLASSGCIVCPACRTDQRIECVDRLPMEYTLLAIINAQENYMKETCEQHQVKLSFWCKTCNRAACGECLFEDHPTHTHDILRSSKYISNMKQNAYDITTRFFDGLTKKEESLYKLIFECTANISCAFKNINGLRKDTEEARELMKSINEEATISSATTLHETAKFLGLKWNIQDVNTLVNSTGILESDNPLVDPDDDISREKAKIKENAKLEQIIKKKEENMQKNKDNEDAKRIKKSKTMSAIDTATQPEKTIQENSVKSKRKQSKAEELLELDQLEKAIEESLKEQEALVSEIKKDEGKINTKEASSRKEKTGKKSSKKRQSIIPPDDKPHEDESANKPQAHDITDDQNNGQSEVAKDKETIPIEDDTATNNDSGHTVDSTVGTINVAEIEADLVKKREKDRPIDDSGTINADSGLSEDSKSLNYPASDAVNQARGKLSDCIQVPGFMICVEGQNGRLGQISWGPQGLHVHVLQFQQADYDLVITATLFNLLTPTSSPTIFLELTADQTRLGRVYVSLWGNLRRAGNFLSLCLGTEGDSYLNTKFLQVYNVGAPGERVLGGDYEYNTGKGGRGVLADLEWNGDYSMPMTAGLITAAGSGQSANNSLFLICTQSDPSRNFSCPFGKVYEGLRVVKEALKLTAVKQVYVSDCGVVIIPPGIRSMGETKSQPIW